MSEVEERDDDVQDEDHAKHADRSPDKDSKDNKDKDDDKDDDGDGGGGADKDKDKPHSRWPLIIGIIVVILGIIAGVIYWLASRGKISTDDAYTDGRAVSIAANVSGYVVALNVDDNSFVHAGQVLLTIDPRENRASLLQAQANLALARAQLASAQINLVQTRVRAPAQLQQAQAQLAQAEAQRVQTLRSYRRQLAVDQRATAAADVDQAKEQLQAADASIKQARAQVATASLIPELIASAEATVQQQQAQVRQAAASLEQATVKLSYNVITAPQDGWITRRNVELGTFVQTGQQIFYIVTTELWITANFKETQLDQIRPGEKVLVLVDAYPKIKLHGHVQSIQQGSGARFTEFPAENATGNFVKIVRRVPVKIVVDRGLPEGWRGLPLGISADPTVYVK